MVAASGTRVHTGLFVLPWLLEVPSDSPVASNEVTCDTQMAFSLCPLWIPLLTKSNHYPTWYPTWESPLAHQVHCSKINSWSLAHFSDFLRLISSGSKICNISLSAYLSSTVHVASIVWCQTNPTGGYKFDRRDEAWAFTNSPPQVLPVDFCREICVYVMRDVYISLPKCSSAGRDRFTEITETFIKTSQVTDRNR